MASSSAQSSVGCGPSTLPQFVEVIPTKRNPEIWKNFDLCKMSFGLNKARCKFCGSFFKQDANSTLKNHIELKYCKALKNEASQGQATMSSDGNIFAYSVDAVREQMAHFVIQQSLPFNHFDNPRLTRLIQQTLQPRYTHVSRSTLRRDCLKMWKKAKNDLILNFENLQTGVSLTCDVWSAPHGSPDSYICVTAHWVQPETWQLMKRTVAFELFDYPHTGENLFYTLDKVIKTFKLDNKIFSISFDNASNNTSAVQQLILKYKPICEGIFFHSRCVAHIINLAVQDGIRVIEETKDNFKKMLQDIFSSTKTHTRYRKFCKESNTKYLGPNWDVTTRWDSTCNMFEKALQQKESLIVFHNLLAGKGRVQAFDPLGWDNIEQIAKMLHVFKNATTFLSGVYYPTSTLVLNQIFLMSSKMNEMSYSPSPICDMIPPMKDKLLKYFKEMPPVITCAAALNPCLNVSGVETLLEKISFDLELHEEDVFYSQTLKTNFNKYLSNLFDVYLSKYGTTSTIHQQMRNMEASSSSSLDPQIGFYNLLRNENSKRQRGNTPSSELGRYISTDFLSTMTPQEFMSFDILAWWKGKEDQFPILSAMARDLLSVQASTVASESAFSVSGRVISLRRTRLTPQAVEMSICLKDHLDAAERIQDKSSLEGEMDYESQLLQEEVEAGLSEGITDEEEATFYSQMSSDEN